MSVSSKINKRKYCGAQGWVQANGPGSVWHVLGTKRYGELLRLPYRLVVARTLCGAIKINGVDLEEGIRTLKNRGYYAKDRREIDHGWFPKDGARLCKNCLAREVSVFIPARKEYKYFNIRIREAISQLPAISQFLMGVHGSLFMGDVL